MTRDPLAIARARRDALDAEHKRAVTAAGQAHQVLDAVVAKRDAAAAARDAARDAYSNAPSSRNGSAVTKTANAHTLAELACSRPRSLAQDADQAVEVAARALCECDTEIRSIERERELARLRQVASPDGFRAATRDHFERLFALLAECDGVVEKIDAEYQASIAAAVEAGVEPLGGHHWITPLLEHAAAEQPGALHVLDHPEGVVGSSPVFAPGRYATDPRPSALDAHRVLASIRGTARSAAAPHALLPIGEGWLAVARARLEVLAATPQTPEAVRAAMAVTPGAALEVAPEPSPFFRALAAITGTVAAE